jgi:hypothetical protein
LYRLSSDEAEPAVAINTVNQDATLIQNLCDPPHNQVSHFRIISGAYFSQLYSFRFLKESKVFTLNKML